MRILLVSHPPLDLGLGAAQIALNLGAALRARGHEAVVWSPEPLSDIGRWGRWQAQRRAIEGFASRSGPWDAIDVPGISVSPALARLAPIVARSVQPELLYAADELRARLARPSPRSARDLLHAPYTASAALALLRGWQRARRIVCLGHQEHGFMLRRFPRWAAKLGRYVTAPAPEERAAFARVHAARVPRLPDARAGAAGAGVRFLWIGRWAAHKGTAALLRFVRSRAVEHPGDTFTIAGCGPAAVRDCPAGLLASGRLRLVPAFQRVELPELLAAHDVGLFTSRVEGWGLCLNEMLEAGLPVAATPAGGVLDLRPFWGPRLLPFPPPAEVSAPDLDPASLARYLHWSSWEEIARRYEEEALLPAVGRAGSGGDCGR